MSGVPTIPQGGAPAHEGAYTSGPSRLVGPHAPRWFLQAPAPDSTGSVEVRGARIRFLSWGAERGPATVLVHGGGAHAQWWAPLARLIAPHGRVVAMDFSGHGVSDRRADYSLDLWMEEVVEVCRATSDGPATVVAHSFGGIVSTFAATQDHGAFARVVAVDAPIWPGTPDPPVVMPEPTPGRRERVYPDAAAAVSRFRLVPPQACDNDWYLMHIAHHSAHDTGNGWRWRFDPQVFARSAGARSLARFDEDLTDVTCPLGAVIGDRSYLAPSAREALRDGALDIPHRFVPGAGHHVMLDEPLVLVEMIHSLLADPALRVT